MEPAQRPMTSIERARKVALGFAQRLGRDGEVDSGWLMEAVAETVEEAIVEERERCAKIVEGYTPDTIYYTDPDGEEHAGDVYWDQSRGVIAARIRAVEVPLTDGSDPAHTSPPENV